MKKPKLSAVVVVLGPVLLVVFVFGVWWLLGERWVFSSNGEMDINSGDLRERVCVFGVPVKNEVYESALSHEIRRLGVAIPATRVWKRTGQSCLVQRSSINFRYRHVLMGCDDLLDILDEVKAPDEERRAVLERLMTSVRTEDGDRARWQASLLKNDVAGKRGLHVFSPEFEETLKKVHAGQQTQTPVP